MDESDQERFEYARSAQASILRRLDYLGAGLVMWAATLVSGPFFTSKGAQLIFVLSVTTVVSLMVVAWRVTRRVKRARASVHQSVHALWDAYLHQVGAPSSTPTPPVWYFCDNERDANECARLVLAGQKRATTPSQWFFKSRGLVLPAVGDLEIITDWDGVAQCIIRTTAVDIVRFCDVTAEYAQLEGEGDGSLISWRAVHWGYYRRELLGTQYAPQEDMPLVCQQFEVVFP
jgi:uncharacterized protein YhfF